MMGLVNVGVPALTVLYFLTPRGVGELLAPGNLTYRPLFQAKKKVFESILSTTHYHGLIPHPTTEGALEFSPLNYKKQ